MRRPFEMGSKLSIPSETSHRSDSIWRYAEPTMPHKILIVDDAAARVLDVSYGGVCVEMQRSEGDGPPGAFRLIIPPADIAVPVEVVWSRRRDARTWLCGGVVGEDAATSWRAVVDTLT